MAHMMVDVETLGINPGCAVISIGACKFSLDGVIDEFYQVVNLDETLLGKIDPNTVRFWLQQGASARNEFCDRIPGRTQRDTLNAFAGWYASSEIKFIWSHGAPFDIPILEAAYNLHGLIHPWHYRSPRDTRTLFGFGKIYPPGKPRCKTSCHR